MNPLKVLHVVSVDKENYYLRNLADYSDAGEVEHLFVTTASPACDFVKDLAEKGRTVYGLDRPGRKEAVKVFKELSRLFSELDPDVIHTHLFEPSLIGLTAAKLQGRRTVLTRHHSDAVHAIPSTAKRKFYLGLDKYISKMSDHIIAPSRMVRDYLVEKEGVADSKVTIIPYGQTTERFDSITDEQVAAVRGELGMGGDTALVCVSRLYDKKGHKYLFEALAELFKGGLNATLYLVGSGDHQPMLEAQALDLGISKRVRFLGWRNDALAIIKAADIIVHPSLEDALSSAVIESIMLKKPIIATDISGVRDSLDDGKYGKIVPPADPSRFRAALREVLNDIATAKDRASKGREYLLNYMDAGCVADRHVSVYRQVLN